MPNANLARLAIVVLVWMILTASTACLAESMSLDIDQFEWERGMLLPAYCDIPIDLGIPAASIKGVTLHVQGTPREGTMILCKGGGCDSFPCHQTLHAYFLDDRSIKTWIPLESAAGGDFDFEVPLQYADCYPDCYHPCTAKDIDPTSWGFLKKDGHATLRLELQGDLDGCGAMCTAENSIERVTVKVDFVPLEGDELASWGAMKAVFR